MGSFTAPALASPQIQQVVERLVSAYDPLRVYLFGSAARGETGPDSDYDLLILVPDDASEQRRRGRLGYQALRGTGIATDVVVWSQTSFENRAQVVASLPATVLREGVVLYDSQS
jgi:predicted nucleotidyltransferase